MIQSGQIAFFERAELTIDTKLMCLGEKPNDTGIGREARVVRFLEYRLPREPAVCATGWFIMSWGRRHPLDIGT